MDYSIIKSRTFWMVVLMFIVGGGNAIVPMLPAAVEAPAMAILGLLATYFHVNPSQAYNPPQS